MEPNLGYKNNILDGLEVFSSFKLPNSIWDVYEKHAMAKIDDAILKLRGTQYYIKELTPDQAKQELNTLNPIVEVLFDLQKRIEEINDEYFQSFKRKAAEFCQVVEDVYEDLQDIAEEHAAYFLSGPVLEKDWNQPEDDHWDNY
jgi:chemotaxis regulatin CheY-phosphate phosphatase CheZ